MTGIGHRGRRGAPVLSRALLVGGLAVAAAALHARDDPGVLCPLRRLTGIPCPACGSTTVFMDLGAGDVAGAVLANPVTLLVLLGLVVAPLGPGRLWWRLPARRRTGVLLVGLTVAWGWQLGRFGLLPG